MGGEGSSASTTTIGAVDLGVLDEVIVYDRVLSISEIADVMHGRHNPDDLIVRPSDALSYQATVTNTLFTQDLDGYLIGATEYISPAVTAPTLLLEFEQSDRRITFPNDVTGEDSGIGCIGGGSDCPTFDVAGVYGNAVEFDGDYLELPSVHQGLATGSVSFWIRPNSFPITSSTILTTDSDDIGALDITLDSDGHLNFDIYGRDHVTAHRTAAPLTLNTWQHVIWHHYTNDAAGSVSSAIIIDGGLPTTQNHAYPVAPHTLAIGPGRLGNSMAGDAPFDGAIDELAFYNDQILWSVGDIDRAAAVRNGNYYPGLDTDDYVSWPAYLLEFETDRQGAFRNAISDAYAATCTSEVRCPTIVVGQYGDSADFDGTNDQLFTPNAVNPGEDEFTAMAWINPDTLGGVFLAQQQGSGVGRQWLGIFNTGELYTRVHSASAFNSGHVLTAGSWQHVALTSDGTTIKLYVDGVLVNQFDATPQANDGGMVVGNSSVGSVYFDGQIDDLAIIPAALDVTAIRSVMNNRYPAIEIDDPLVDFHIGTTVETDYLTALARHDDARYVTTLMTVSADTCTTCPTIVTQNGSGNSLTFDGVDDWLDVGTSPNLADTHSFGFWMKVEQPPASNQTILALTDDNGNYLPGVLVELTSAGAIRYVDRPQVGGSGGTELTSSGNIADGEWHHVVVTRVFAEFGFPDLEYEMRLYVDGALEGTATTLGDINEEPLALSIGRFRPASPRYFQGELDELSVYAADLTESEVQLLLERNAPAGDQNVISSTAHVSARAGTGLHRFEETVEAALQPQTPIDYPIVDDQAGDLQLFVPFEDVPASETFQNMIGTGDMTCQSPACPSAGVRGIADRAALFDGRDDRIAGATFTADDTTLAAWVEAESGTLIDMRRVLEGFQPPNTPAVDSGTGMWLDMTGLHWFMRDASNGDAKIRYDLPLNLPLGEWAHVAAVFDTSTGVVTAYVDGVEVGSETTAMAAGDAWTGDDPVLGATKFGSSVLDGYLDDVRIYDVALSSAEISTLIANSAPVLRFEFDETSDAPVFNDSSQNGTIGIPTANTAFNATLGETVTTLSPIAGTDGQIGNTALFDGNGAITLDDASPIDALTNDLTIMAWINPDDVTTVQNIIGHTTANSGDGFRFNIDENGQLRFTLTGKKHLVSTATVAPEAWQHVAVVFDSSNDAHFYLDGALVDTISNASTMLPNSDDVVMIGGTDNGSNGLLWPFAGQIDELAVYGRGMGSAEIDSIYQRELRWYRARAVNEITIDTDAPTLELITDYSYRAAGYTQLVVAAGDATSRVALLDVGVRNLGESEFVWQGASECDDSERAGVAWCPVLDLSEGVYELQFRAVDAVGYETTSAITQLIVDATAPMVGSGYSDSWLQATTTDDLTWQIALNGTISNPAVGGLTGSGVVTDSVLVSLVNGLGETLDGAAQRASVTGGAWSVSYQVAGTVPDGLYSVVVSAEDALGNQAETTVGTILLDERASSADVNRWQLPVGTIISDTLVLSGTVSESTEWGGELAVYHLEQTASPFYDSGLDQAHATCTNCPTSTTGVYGNALQFDGVNDSVSIPSPFNPITDSFSIALWFKANGSGTRVLVQQQDGSGTGRALLFLNGSNVLQTNLGAGTGGNFGGTTAVSADSWHHVVLTYDGTVGRIYLDGYLDGEGALTAESADGDLILGHNKANNARFVGAMDEVTIYDHALSAYTVQALANTAANGVGTVRIGFQTVDFSILTDTTDIRATAIHTPTWVTATVDNVGANFSTWTASDDALREDFYTVLLDSTDAQGNRSLVGTVWRGLIDRVPPQIVGSGLQDGGETEYTITLTDFILDEGSADVPCESAEWTVTRYDDALLPHDGRASQITMTCRVSGLESSRDVTVCDAAGNCTTETIQVTVPTVVTVRSADAQGSSLGVWGMLLAVLMLLPIRIYASRER